MTDKLIRDGKVAVLYSSGYGAGWSTWNPGITKDIVFDRELAELVDSGADFSAQLALVTKKWPSAYEGGLPLSIQWVPVGTRFFIDEYDGSESVRIIGPFGYVA